MGIVIASARSVLVMNLLVTAEEDKFDLIAIRQFAIGIKVRELEVPCRHAIDMSQIA